METRKLGNTDLHLSRVGFGCASAWGKTFYKEEDAIMSSSMHMMQASTIMTPATHTDTQKCVWASV